MEYFAVNKSKFGFNAISGFIVVNRKVMADGLADKVINRLRNNHCVSMEDTIFEEEAEDVDIEYHTPSTSEIDVENNTDSQSELANAPQNQYDVLHRTFRDYFINEITETFADELDSLRKVLINAVKLRLSERGIFWP